MLFIALLLRFIDGIISFTHAPVNVTDFSVVNVHVDELSSARICQHKLCSTLSSSVNIKYRLPIKVYYRIWTLRHIRIEIIHGCQNVFWVWTWIGGYSSILWLPWFTSLIVTAIYQALLFQACSFIFALLLCFNLMIGCMTPASWLMFIVDFISIVVIS